MRHLASVRLVPAFGVAAVLLAAACVPLPGGHSLTRRIVAGKQGEDTLVAQDGSTCRVGAEAYAKTQVGDDRTCAWKEVDADGRGRAVPTSRPEPRGLPGRSGRS